MILLDGIRFARKMRRRIAAGEPELRLLPYICRKDRAFLDVGGSVGLYSFVAQKHSAWVYSVEPHPESAAYLRKHFTKNVTVLECALTERAGRFPLYVPRLNGKEITTRSSLNSDANGGLEQVSVEVETKRIDDLQLKPLQLIKIDVGGHELATLHGGQEVIRRDRPCLIVEIEECQHPDGSRDVFDFILALGYSGFFLMDGRLHDLDRFDASLHQMQQNRKRPGHPRSGVYINNFLFIPQGDDNHIHEAMAKAGYLGSVAT